MSQKPTSSSQNAVVNGLLSYSREMDDWVRPVSRKRKIRAREANSFLLGVILNRSINAERAWAAAEWINDSLSDHGSPSNLWKSFTGLGRRRLEGFLRYGRGGRAFHRHYKTFARQLPKSATILLQNYGGDPRRIWNNQRDVSKVRMRLEEIPGIGPALSRMAILNLARNFGLLGGRQAFSQLDVKPDVHVMRVFRCTGLIARNASTRDAIAAAQKLYPRFPAALDGPAFEIGRTWCRPQRPNCSECPLNNVCPKHR